MSESVEQAAPDWGGRARREAASILDECGVQFIGAGSGTITNRDELLGLLAIAWLQGVNLGAHDTLAHVDAAFERMRAAL